MFFEKIISFSNGFYSNFPNFEKNNKPITMKKLSLTLIMLSAFALASLNAQIKVEVNNALDLMNAIQSDAIIELAPGEYNISRIMEEINNPNISLVDNYDGFEPNIYEISNLTIKGGGKATILLEPRYAWVMYFINCTNLKFEGITFGHTESGYCMGGVLGFDSCYTVEISDCSLYGSGTVGIMANMCTNVLVKNSEIHDCSYGLAYIYNCFNVNFQGTTFRNTGEFNLVEITQSEEVSFTKCKFYDNFTNEYMPHLFCVDEVFLYSDEENAELKKSDLTITKCTFKNNKISSFINNDKNLTIKGCKFKGNGFDM